MKKTIFLALFIACAAFGYKASATTGDVDGDGIVTAADVTALYNYLLNNDTEFLATSDVDGDGNVTAADITVIYNILLGEDPDPGIDDNMVNIEYEIGRAHV